MKKINNHGFGIKEMLFYVAIIFIFLLVSCYYIYVFYTGLDDETATEYAKIELTLKEAARLYALTEETTSSVSVSTLISKGYLTSLNDENGYSCNGYVLIVGDAYNTYIKCPKYTSKNYDEKYE